MADIVETFSKNFLPKPHTPTHRKVGIELEFPIVQDNGEAVSYQTINNMFAWLESRGWQVTVDTGTGEKVEAVRSVSGGSGRFGYEKDVIGTDVGYCTVETALSPEDSLFALEDHWNKIKKLLLEYFSQENCHMLGYGVQPLSHPHHNLVANKGRYRFFEQDSPNRFIDQRYGQDLTVFAISAANQCHVDIYKEEAIAAVNMMNGLAPLISAVTANSPVWRGKQDQEWIDIREIFWDKGWSNRLEQTGIPDAFSDFSDYVDRLCQFRPLMVKRGDEYIKIMDCKTFGDFVRADGESVGQSVDGSLVRLEGMPEDIYLQSGFAWWQARLAPAHGTLEIRPCSQQPENATLSVAALALGLIENLEEAFKMYAEYTLEDWRKLRFDALRHGLEAELKNKSPILPLVNQLLEIAKEGLRKRKLGEEKFLTVLENRTQKALTVANEVKAVFDKNNLIPFFDLVEIRN
jgi:glutamate--cysteine ligase